MDTKDSKNALNTHTVQGAFEMEPELGTVQHGSVFRTKRGLKSRHAQMIAIGGTIGTGLFVGSGQALAAGGPLFLFLGYCIMTALVFGIITAMAELSTYLPLEGATMAYFGTRYVSPSLGFAMGWLYWYSFAIIAPYEITAAAVVIDYWPNNVPIAVWITIFLVIIIILNCFPVKFYGETEFYLASLKVMMIIGLLILSVVLFFAGGPSHDRLGFRYWAESATHTKYVSGSTGRFCAFLYTLIYSTFSFNFAPELLVITAGEMAMPTVNMLKAAKRYFWRLIIFYVGGAFAIGVIVSSRNPDLVNASGVNASPWVIAIKSAGIHGLDSVVNAVIITSAFSSGNSYVYMATRSLYSLAVAGSAPRLFTKCTKGGVPYMALIATCPWLLLAYMNVATAAGTVFDWFINLTNTAGFTSWVCCSIIYIRFRKARMSQGVHDLTWTSRLQPYASYVCGVAFTILCLLNGFGVFIKGNWSTNTFLTSYLGLPIFFAIYFGHRVYHWRDRWAYKPEDIDITTGRDEVAALERQDTLDLESKKGRAPKNKVMAVIKTIWE